MKTDVNIDLSIIIVSFNVRAYLLECIVSIKKQTHDISYEVIVVDNNSNDGSYDAVKREHPEVITIFNPQNVGFAQANNMGFAKAIGEYILLLNPDTLLTGGAIRKVVSFLQRTPRAGIASCRIISPDGTLQKSIHAFSTVTRNLAWAVFIDRFIFHENRRGSYYQSSPRMVDSVNGAFMVVRRAALGDGPLLNPDYFMYSEEKDLSLRLKRAGWETWFVPTVEIIHYGGKSTSLMPVRMFVELQKSQAKFYNNFYTKEYALALCASWWFVLLSQTLFSFLMCFSRTGRKRFTLFFHAAIAFPRYVIIHYRCNHSGCHTIE